MSVKRFILVNLSGIALACGALYGADYYFHWGLKDRIDWKSVFVWSFYGAGFVTALWLFMWSALWRKVLPPHRKTTEGSSIAVSHITEQSAEQQNKNKVQEPLDTKQPIQTPAASATTAVEPSNNTSTTPPPTAPVNRPAMPQRMAVQNKAILSVAPVANPGTASSSAESPMQATAAQSPTQPTMPAHPISQKDQDIQDLAKIDADLDMMAFKHVSLEGKIIDLVYSSDDVAVLCKVFSDQHTWTVDTTQPIDQVAWTDETGQASNPCLDLLTQAAVLEKMETEATIYPSIVLMRGQIQNIEQVRDYLAQNQILLLQAEPSNIPGIQTIHELLKDKFSLFPEDEESTEEESNG